MCGRFTIASPNKIKKRFKTSNQMPMFEPSYNVAPLAIFANMPIVYSI